MVEKTDRVNRDVNFRIHRSSPSHSQNVHYHQYQNRQAQEKLIQGVNLYCESVHGQRQRLAQPPKGHDQRSPADSDKLKAEWKLAGWRGA